jgi:polysaccharide biosynthesis transport protein
VIYAELYRVLWRRRLVIATGTAVCVLLAFAFTSAQHKLYTATATVQVVPVAKSSANDSFEASQRLSRSYAEIYTRGAVAPRMTQLIGGGTPVRLKELKAGQVKDLDLLAVSGVASDPRRAVLIANAGSRALEDFSPRERLSLITAARLPTTPSSPNLVRTLVLALLGGFLLSAGIALALNAIVQPIGGPEELEDELDLPVLAVIPRLRLVPRPTWGPDPSDDPRGDPLLAGARRPLAVPEELHAIEAGPPPPTRRPKRRRR